jgi:hypothetical protein
LAVAVIAAAAAIATEIVEMISSTLATVIM